MPVSRSRLRLVAWHRHPTPQYLQLVHGYSPLSAGLRALPFARMERPSPWLLRRTRHRGISARDPGLLVGAYDYALRVEAYLGSLIDRYSRFGFAA